MDAKITGKIIQTKRKELGLTQIQLAEKLNVSNRAISKWENGDGYPDVSILEDISKVLGVTIDELLTGNPPKKHVENIDVIQETEQDNTKLNFIITSIVGFVLLFGQSVACVAAELALVHYRPFYMFVEIYILSAVIIAYVISIIVYLIGLAKYKYNRKEFHKNTKISFISFILLATISPVAIAVRMIMWHSYVLSYTIFALWIVFMLIMFVVIVKSIKGEKNEKK